MLLSSAANDTCTLSLHINVCARSSIGSVDADTVSLVFCRHPLQRLVSAYYDKLAAVEKGRPRDPFEKVRGRKSSLLFLFAK